MAYLQKTLAENNKVFLVPILEAMYRSHNFSFRARKLSKMFRVKNGFIQKLLAKMAKNIGRIIQLIPF